jgi:hypothetical protein
MTMPKRLNLFAPLSSEQELELAEQMLELEDEAELDHFLPLLLPLAKAAAPLLMNVAGPLIKNVAGRLLGGGGRGRRSRPQNQQEQFLGKIIGGLFGEIQAEDHEQEQFLGGILKGILGEQETAGEQEQFLGNIIGKIFGGGRELEAENYVQEQFLGGILGKLLGRGELETEGEVSQERWIARARRFVRLVSTASRQAASEITQLMHTGARPTPHQVRRIVFRAFVRAARQITPRIASVAFPGGQPAPAQNVLEGTLLEMMIHDARPLGPARAAATPPAASGQASWVRQGNRLVITL